MKQKISSTQRTLNAWAIVLLIWSIYRYYFKTSLPIWFDEFIAKPTVFLLPIYYYIRHYEKGKFFEGVDLKIRDLKGDLGIGLFFGLIFFLTGIGSLIIKKHTVWPFPPIGPVEIISCVVLAFASSFTEEILSRGFVLKRLYEESKNMITSSFFASFLFFFLHVPILFTNDKIWGGMLLQIMITDIVLSLAVSIIYLQRRCVIVPIMIHAFYNVSLYLFLR